MKRKMVALLLTVSMLAAMLTGCGGSGKTDEETEQGKAAEESETAENGETAEGEDTSGNDEIVNLLWQWPSASGETPGLAEVEAELNEMLERDIGVHVTLLPVNLYNAQQEATLMVSAGEQLDIMLTGFASIGPLVSSELILPIDELLEEYGQDILANSHTATRCCYDGKVYGVCRGNVLNNGYGYLIKKEYWDKYNLEELYGFDEEQLYTFDQIEEMFRIVKEGEGDNFYCMVPWNMVYEPMNYGYMEYDKISGDLSGGVLMLNRDFKDLTVYDLFETEEYAQYCDLMYKWAQLGYIAPDAAVTTEAPDSITAASNYLGNFYWSKPQDMMWYNSTLGCDLVGLDIVPPYVAANGTESVMWNIPVTSVNPAKAVETLNYVWGNQEAMNLLAYGREGIEYEVLDEYSDGENYTKQIKYLADDMASLPYFQSSGVYGSSKLLYQVYPTAIDAAIRDAALEDAVPESRYSGAMGYVFVQDSVATEITAVQAVIAQYCPSLNCGSLDPSKALPEFIDALKAAGIDKIIAENQRQLDEWAANR